MQRGLLIESSDSSNRDSTLSLLPLVSPAVHHSAVLRVHSPLRTRERDQSVSRAMCGSFPLRSGKNSGCEAVQWKG